MATISPGDVTVFIVDDDDQARKGVQRLLDSYCYKTETFSSAKAFLKRLPVDGVCCLLLDLQMPEMSGMELQEELASAGTTIPIVFLTGHGDIPTSVRAIKQGAEDFLPKLAEEKDLLDAVQRAVQRSRDLLADQQQLRQVTQSAATLTDREREVCQCVIAGLPNKHIASRLGITVRTVKAHRAKVMLKFNVESVADLVRRTEKAGIRPVVVYD
jgi:FixJ family two-component response regulator